VPGKKRIWCHKRFNFIKRSSAKDFSFHSQSYPLFVGEPKPMSLELIFQSTILFDEIVDDCLLVTIKPAGQSEQQKMEGLDYNGHCTNRLSIILFNNNMIRSV
jgi:hypothetical protein